MFAFANKHKTLPRMWISDKGYETHVLYVLSCFWLCLFLLSVLSMPAVMANLSVTTIVAWLVVFLLSIVNADYCEFVLEKLASNRAALQTSARARRMIAE